MLFSYSLSEAAAIYSAWFLIALVSSYILSPAYKPFLVCHVCHKGPLLHFSVICKLYKKILLLWRPSKCCNLAMDLRTSHPKDQWRTPFGENTCSAIYEISMELHQLQEVAPASPRSSLSISLEFVQSCCISIEIFGTVRRHESCGGFAIGYFKRGSHFNCGSVRYHTSI